MRRRIAVVLVLALAWGGISLPADETPLLFPTSGSVTNNLPEVPCRLRGTWKVDFSATSKASAHMELRAVCAKFARFRITLRGPNVWRVASPAQLATPRVHVRWLVGHCATTSTRSCSASLASNTRAAARDASGWRGSAPSG